MPIAGRIERLGILVLIPVIINACVATLLLLKAPSFIEHLAGGGQYYGVLQGSMG
jgi:hypothetical protein